MSALAFELPSAQEAAAPPEERGVARDEVRLLVANGATGAIDHTSFKALPHVLDPGDLLVVNVSATLPAAIAARRADGTRAMVHVATRAPGLDAGWRVVEVRSGDGARPGTARPATARPGTARPATARPATAGERLTLRGGAHLELTAPYAASKRLMLARFDAPDRVERHLARYGEPIRYGYAAKRWPLTAYQNVYAITPGSAEMPSAGRPFTGELIAALLARGVFIAAITLHCGVSSPERHEPPFPEWFDVPAHTAARVQATRRNGGRVIAVGTTVVRALETGAGEDGAVRPGSGWTNLVIGPERPPRVVNGLITGWHEPNASHLTLLEAIAGQPLLARSYQAALEHGYLWHEFGDSHLILPP